MASKPRLEMLPPFRASVMNGCIDEVVRRLRKIAKDKNLGELKVRGCGTSHGGEYGEIITDRKTYEILFNTVLEKDLKGRYIPKNIPEWPEDVKDIVKYSPAIINRPGSMRKFTFSIVF